jgi:hypothetical protein
MQWKKAQSFIKKVNFHEGLSGYSMKLTTQSNTVHQGQ